VSGRIRSGRSGRLSGHLMLGYFRFWVVSDRVGSVIGSSSVRLFWISIRLRSGWLSDHLVSGHFRFRIVSGQVGLVIGSSSVGLFRVLNHIGLNWIRSD
jgi:hypothetical protein